MATTLGITLEQLDERKDKGDKLHGPLRPLLQRFGTDAMKAEFGINVWIELLETQVMDNSLKISIISDLRFDSEIEYFLNDDFYECHVIEVVRDDLEVGSSTDSHSSENGFEDTEPDLIINNIMGESEENLKLIMKEIFKSS